MRSVADLDKLYAVATFLVNERGYLVIGEFMQVHAVGETLKVLWNVEIDQPLRVIAKTDRRDWLEQGKLVAKKFSGVGVYKENRTQSDSETGNFYKVITD